MKKWKQAIVIGMAALYLVGCKESHPAQETGTDKVKESAQTQADKVQESAHTQAEEAEETEPTSAADAEEIKMSNPMQEVSGPEALSEIGVSMNVPEAAKEVQSFIINQVVAEISFKLEDNPYSYRGSATAEDFSGIFEEFEDEVATIPGTEEMGIDGDLLIKTTKSSGKLASWSKNGASYTLYTPSSVEDEALSSLCQDLMEKN